MTAPETTACTYKLDIPLHGGNVPLTANQRLHWREKAKRTAVIRSAANLLARYERIGPRQHIAVGLHYQPGDRRRRDPSNLVPTQKPAVDGLVDAGIVPDDTPQYVTEHMPVIHPGPGERRLWLEIEVQQ